MAIVFLFINLKQEVFKMKINQRVDNGRSMTNPMLFLYHKDGGIHQLFFTLKFMYLRYISMFPFRHIPIRKFI
jgi:hypothetical protein